MRSTLIAVLLAALSPAAITTAQEAAPDDEEPRFSVLVYSRTSGFRHGSIPAGVKAIQKLGEEHEFDVDHTEVPEPFTTEGLAAYDTVVFLNTTQNVLDEEHEKAFEAYIRDGGGFVGIHAAADTEYEWEFYGELVGAYFGGHPHIQEATITIDDRFHPSSKHLPSRWVRTDEWYNYKTNPRDDVHVIATLDERSYEGGTMDHDHPITWCHELDEGRAWYTGLGHTNESYEEPAFLGHLLGGLEWTAGVAKGDDDAAVEDHDHGG